MKQRNPFANRRQQSTRERHRAAQPSARQTQRVILALRATAAREIKKGLANRIASRENESVAD